jgi:hypothetical protein
LGRTGADAVCGICGVESNWTILATEELAPVGVLAMHRTRAIGVGALARLRLVGIRATTGATGSEFGASRSGSTKNGDFMRRGMRKDFLNSAFANREFESVPCSSSQPMVTLSHECNEIVERWGRVAG